MTALLERAIAAHGGREAWSGGAGFAVELRVGGAAWPLRLRRAPGLLRARVSTQAPEAEFLDFPTAGLRGMFEPGMVRIEDAFAHRVAERHDPRAAFRTLRHKLRWDDCDLARARLRHELLREYGDAGSGVCRDRSLVSVLQCDARVAGSLPHG
jgi:hypothetical protein